MVITIKSYVRFFNIFCIPLSVVCDNIILDGVNANLFFKGHFISYFNVLDYELVFDSFSADVAYFYLVKVSRKETKQIANNLS